MAPTTCKHIGHFIRRNTKGPQHVPVIRNLKHSNPLGLTLLLIASLVSTRATRAEEWQVGALNAAIFAAIGTQHAVGETANHLQLARQAEDRAREAEQNGHPDVAARERETRDYELARAKDEATQAGESSQATQDDLDSRDAARAGDEEEPGGPKNSSPKPPPLKPWLNDLNGKVGAVICEGGNCYNGHNGNARDYLTSKYGSDNVLSVNNKAEFDAAGDTLRSNGVDRAVIVGHAWEDGMKIGDGDYLLASNAQAHGEHFEGIPTSFQSCSLGGGNCEVIQNFANGSLAQVDASNQSVWAASNRLSLQEGALVVSRTPNVALTSPGVIASPTSEVINLAQVTPEIIPTISPEVTTTPVVPFNTPDITTPTFVTTPSMPTLQPTISTSDTSTWVPTPPPISPTLVANETSSTGLPQTSYPSSTFDQLYAYFNSDPQTRSPSSSPGETASGLSPTFPGNPMTPSASTQPGSAVPLTNNSWYSAYYSYLFQLQSFFNSLRWW